jgi:RING finger protein 113A
MGGFKKKGTFGRGNVRKRAASDEEDEDAAAPSDAPAAVAPAEKRKKTLALGGSTAERDKIQVFAFEGDRSVQQRGDGGATAELQIDTEKDKDGRAMREKVLATAAARAEGFEDDKIYKGSSNYVDYRAGFRKEHSIASEKGGGAHGPMRASANVRMTFIMDYKPDICKDYKETGYCGYGDSCKFLHDRGDYKHGWQLDREWEEKEKARKEALAKLEQMERGLGEDGEAQGEEAEDEDDAMPSACPICGENWWEGAKDPVVTRCKHHFCEHCALRHNAKEKLCFTCQKPTGGTFNSAKDIAKRVKEMKDTGASWAKTNPNRSAGAGGAAAKTGVEHGAVGAQGWLLG